MIDFDTALPGLRVLVVDDDDDIRRISLFVLDGWEAQAVGAANANAAEKVLAGAEIDVVVTDMVMPGLTGRQFLDWLATSHPTIGVVAMSGVRDQLIAATCRANVRATLDKPFTATALLEAVASAA